jgi:hypothetical protein
MDWLQFFASLVGSLAWPSALVAMVLLLRRELVQILRRLRRLKYGDAEAEFGEKLEEVEEEIEELPVPKSALPRHEFRQYFKGLDRFSNNSAVFISWLEVESAILNLARRAKLLQPNMPASRAAQLLLQEEMIDRPTFQAVRELQELRNIAVHPSDMRVVSNEDAERFKRLADRVAAVLEDQQRRLAGPS